MVGMAEASIYRSRTGRHELPTPGVRARGGGAPGRGTARSRAFGRRSRRRRTIMEEKRMEGIVYLVGLVVIVMFVLSFLGLR